MLLVGAIAVVGTLWWTGRPIPVPAAPVGIGTEDPSTAAGAEPAGAPTGADTVTVHVAGAVGRPGLVQLRLGARVADAIEAVGGLQIDADTTRLNLAREVVDGERLDVLRVGEVAADGHGEGAAAPSTAGDAGGAVRPDGTLDLNLADAGDLEELPGVGPVLAGRILEWRETNGPFTEVGQLRDVAGIGEKTFQSLAPLVAV